MGSDRGWDPLHRSLSDLGNGSQHGALGSTPCRLGQQLLDVVWFGFAFSVCAVVRGYLAHHRALLGAHESLATSWAWLSTLPECCCRARITCLFITKWQRLGIIHCGCVHLPPTCFVPLPNMALDDCFSGAEAVVVSMYPVCISCERSTHWVWRVSTKIMQCLNCSGWGSDTVPSCQLCSPEMVAHEW